MPQEHPNKSSPRTKIWLSMIGLIGTVIGIVPPAITALRPTPGNTQNGNGNTINQGSTVNSNNTNNTTYLSMWTDGMKTIFGTPRVQPAQHGVSQIQRIQTPSEPNHIPTETKSDMSLTAQTATPEPGAVGRLVDNASLANEATWSPEVSRVNRLLTFHFRAEATASDENPGTLDATLSRDGKDVCTISLNTQTSANSNGVRYANSICSDTVSAGSSYTYRAKVNVSGMIPIGVRLGQVDAILK